MKRKDLYIGTACLLLILTHLSCNKKESNKENLVSSEVIKVERTYHLFDDDTKPACNIRIAFEFPESVPSEADLKSVQSVFIEKTFGADFVQFTPAEAVNEYINRYVDQFRQLETADSNNPDLEEDDFREYEDETGYLYYTDIKCTIVFKEKGIVSFTVDKTSYEGGAHSSRSVYGYVFDLNTNRLLQEADFAGDQYNTKIAFLLAEKIADNNGLSNPYELENIGYTGVDEIVPNNNFTVGKEGMTYYFNENEIAGTMVGITKVFLPYEEISIYLLKENPLSSLVW